MARRRVLAVVVLAVLAGCGGFSAGEGGEGSGGDAPTLTPASVPGEDVPINEGPGGVRLDATQIVETHRGTLANASHTVVETLRVGPADNVTFRQRTAVHRAAGGTPYYADVEIDVTHRGIIGRGTDVWWNGEHAYYQYTFDVGRQTYYRASEAPSLRLRIDGTFRDVLDALGVSRVGRGRDGSLFVGGYIDDASTVPRTRFMTEIHNATMSLRIGPDGVVRRMAVGYNASYYDRGRLRVRYTHRVTDVGTTNVSSPAWLAEFENVTAD